MDLCLYHLGSARTHNGRRVIPSSDRGRPGQALVNPNHLFRDPEYYLRRTRKVSRSFPKICRGSDPRFRQRKTAAYIFELGHDRTGQQLALNYCNLSVDDSVEIRLSAAREGDVFPRVAWCSVNRFR